MIRANIFAGIDQTLENGFREIIFIKKVSGKSRSIQIIVNIMHAGQFLRY